MGTTVDTKKWPDPKYTFSRMVVLHTKVYRFKGPKQAVLIHLESKYVLCI